MKFESIKGFRNGIKKFGEDIAVLVNTALLTIVYIIGIGITSIFARIFRKKFLDLKIENKESYWENLNLKTKSIESYYRQF